MKNKLYIVFTILISVLMINIVQAENLLKFDKTYGVNQYIESLKDVISINNKLYILSENQTGTSIINPDDTFETANSKAFTELTNASIIKYNTNIMLVGIEKNALKVYLLDENLQVQNQKETSYLIDLDSTIKTYSYDNKVYLMLFESETMLSNSIYEIDENLNITDNNLSSYDSELMKKVLKGDYYIIRMNDIENNGRITHYYDTSYNKDNIVLVGNTSNISYDDTNGFAENAHLTILDHEGNKILDIEHQDYTNYIDVEFIKGKIIILAKNEPEEFILVYDTSGKLEEKIQLQTELEGFRMNNLSMHKLNGKLLIYSAEPIRVRERINLVSIYTYDLSIIANENENGTIEVVPTAEPNSEVIIKITPNTGFEVESIEVIDNTGNILTVADNKFIMPEDDVYITVNYKAIVDNPETNDIIISIVITTILIIGIGIIAFRRFKWLK